MMIKKLLIIVPIILLTLSCNRSNENKVYTPVHNQNLNEKIYEFPKNFLWGTATAAYQVEGNIINDWSTDKLDAGKASDHYIKYEEDFKFLKNIDNNVHRLSIEWARIEPEKGKFNLKEVEHYKKVLQSLKDKNIIPMITLHHFTNPTWIAKKGGWANLETIKDFSDFVNFIMDNFSEYTDYWITVNEPNVYAFRSFDSGEWPPYIKDRKKALQVMGNLIKAHAEAYHIIHKKDKDSKVSFSHHIAIMHPQNKFNPIDHIATSFVNNTFNEAFFKSITTGELKISIPGVEGVDEPYNDKLKNTLDFIGFNYYTRWMINWKGEQKVKDNVEVTDLNWEIYPQGMYEALELVNKYAKPLNIPIYITENGIADEKDTKRSKYIKTHLFEIWKAIQNGINVKGYIYWTLMDNFEWADKYRPKFGLMTIDRKERESSKIYSDICKNNGIRESIYNNY